MTALTAMTWRPVARTVWRVILLLAVLLALASIPYPAAAQAPAAGELTLAEAVRLIAAAQSDAGSKNLRLTIAVVNQRGDVIAVGRMDGANPGTVDTAIGKAMVSAMFGQPSAALVARANTPVAQGVNAQAGGRLRFLQGALPIVREGFTVGAIAGSGASAQQDEDAVRAALLGAGFK
jgi:glc operon protein GlcG